MYKMTIAAALLFLTACKSNEIGDSKDVNPEAIFQEYTISATEGDAGADFFAQFRFGGDAGTTLVLNDDSHLSLNGTKLQVDSGGLGAYYQAKLPIGSTTGQHSWTFVDGNQKKYTNSIAFKPFTLVTNLKPAIHAADLELEFAGLKENDRLDISINDTSSLRKYHDLDTVIFVKNAKAMILGSQLQRLAPGPIFFEIGYHKTEPLKESTKEGGSLRITYELKSRKVDLLQ